MPLPLYLAKTIWEITEFPSAPERTAYMACHFSPYGDGLDIPQMLPRCNMLILNDRVPIWQVDTHNVTAQLTQIMEATGAQSVLLDLQRPGCPQGLITALAALPFSVGVTEGYADVCDCAVFATVPMHRPLSDAVERWPGRQLWLDAAGNTQRITVTAKGSVFTSLPRRFVEGIVHREEKLHCSYTIHVTQEQAEFTLFRTQEDIDALLQEAEALGFTKAIGLYQELG